MYKKMLKYFSKHPNFNSTVHFLAGVGFGFLLTHPFADPHPVRWGVFLIAVAVLGHLYAGWQKK